MQKSTRLRWFLTAVLALAVSTPAMAHAQSTITGKVVGENGDALFGAQVSIDALQIAVGTNAQGQYTIAIPGARAQGQQVVMRVRAIGFSPVVKTITLSPGAQTQNFELKVDINRLNQVVVTGVTAGTEQKKLPFTVAQVTDKDMPVPGANALTQLQGKVPGANIVSQSGRPGSTPSIILRGPQSINASGRSQDPLIIIDGIIQQAGNGLGEINPNDIENIEVVKGAAAASLYGSRAGYGVIQITTKSGKATGEGVRFTTRFEGGASDIEGRYKLAKASAMTQNEDRTRYCVNTDGNNVSRAAFQNCQRTVDIYAEAFRINNVPGDFSIPPANFINDHGIAAAPPKIAQRGLFQVNRWPTTYDPIGQMITNGAFSNVALDMTGKFGRSNFFASFGNLYQEGSQRFLAGFRRKNVRLNVDNTFAGNWSVSVRTYYANTWQDGNGSTAGLGLTRQPAYVDLLRTDSFGRLFIRSAVTNQGDQNSNPLYTALNSTRVNDSDRFQGQVSTKYQPFTWLDGEWNFGYDRSNYQTRRLDDRGALRGTSQTVALGFVQRQDGYDQSYNTALNITARRDITENLHGRLTLRALYEQQDGQGDLGSGGTLVVAGLNTSTAATASQTISSTIYSIRQLGIFEGVDIDYKDRYILSGLIRRDGSSLFGQAQRWKTYGRGSFAWRASEEDFWKPIGKYVNDFKLRASVGQAGNRPNTTAQYETFTIGTGGTLSANILGNKFLRPEVSTETEIGFDAEILNKYGLTVTKAQAIVKDQILSVPLPASAGFNSQWLNAGTLTNNTVEVSLNVPLVEKKQLTWTARVTYDATKSKITTLNVTPYFQSAAGQQGSESMFQVRQGENFGTIYGRRFITACKQLPTAFQSKCGDGLDYQKNSDGFIVWTGAGNSQADGIKKNLWTSENPGINGPWGVATSWGMPMILRDSTGTALLTPNGSALPDFHWALAQNFQYKRFTAYVLLDAVKGNNIWNEERQWSYGDLQHADVDQYNKTVETAKPIGYYWRNNVENTAGVGGLYDILGPSSRTVEDASYVKLREISFGYRIGKVGGIGDWTVSVVGRNLKTWTRYNGFDPEVGLTGGNNGSGALNAIDAFGFPNTRTFTLTLTSSF